MSEPRTPQVPMVDGNGEPFYPLTQYNQIVMPDGSRWDGKGGGAQIDDTSASTEKVYSSQKTQYELDQLSQQIDDLEAGGLKSDPAEDESTEAPEMGSVPNNADQLGGMTYQMIVNAIYPIGRTITTLSDADNPNTLYPWQTWERTAKGRMIIGTGTPENNDDGTSPGDYDYALGSKGGEAEHALTVDELASHYHPFNVRNGAIGGWTIPLGGDGAASYNANTERVGGPLHRCKHLEEGELNA